MRKYEDLPQAARDYVEYVEQAIGVHISYVSVGAGRDEIILPLKGAAMKPTYESPLASRYASKTMLHLFSPGYAL